MNEDKPYKRLLDSITNGFKKVLDSNILGLYVHGSIAFGCFMPDKSDLDFIALVRQPLHCSEKHHLLECILKEMPHAPAKGIEMSVVLAKYAKEFLYPTPYELHFSLEWLNLAVEHPDTLCTDGEKVDYDLAAHFKVITERGLVWYGDAIDKVFSEVPWNVYLDSIERDKPKTFDLLSEEPVYHIINACRVLAAKQDHLVLSKLEGGIWGLSHCPAVLHPAIRKALEWYAGNSSINTKPCFSANELLDIFTWIQAN